MHKTKRGRKSRPRRNRGATPVGPVGTVTVPRGYGSAAFPVALRTKLRYATYGTLAAGGTNAWTETVFRTNSVYDPDFTLTGASPSGFGALATLYNRYRVLSGDWSVTFVNDTGATVNVATVETDASTTFSNIISATQQGFSRQSALSDQSGGRNQWIWRHRIKPWKVLGVTKQRYMNDDGFAAAVSTNPSLTSFLHLGCQSVTSTAQVQTAVIVVFDVVFFDRVLLA